MKNIFSGNLSSRGTPSYSYNGDSYSPGFPSYSRIITHVSTDTVPTYTQVQKLDLSDEFFQTAELPDQHSKVIPKSNEPFFSDIREEIQTT